MLIFASYFSVIFSLELTSSNGIKSALNYTLRFVKWTFHFETREHFDLRIIYDKEVFIDANNINVFREKVFFCFSCNSNKNNSKSLARLSKTYGIEAFVGFGNIPTDYIEGVPFSKRCIAIYKGKIVKIMKYALYYAVENNENVDNLVRIIKILTCKEIQSLRQQKRFHGRDAVIEQLYKFKDEIKIYGDVYAKL